MGKMGKIEKNGNDEKKWKKKIKKRKNCEKRFVKKSPNKMDYRKDPNLI